MLRVTFALSFCLASVALAQGGTQFSCTLDSNVRRVEILYQTGDDVPCEVHYIKETEAPSGAPEVLWNAQNESGYCEARMEEFIARLESLGWACEAPVAEAVEDDTDVLSTADDTDE